MKKIMNKKELEKSLLDAVLLPTDLVQRASKLCMSTYIATVKPQINSKAQQLCFSFIGIYIYIYIYIYITNRNSNIYQIY